jgi:hypothetical protein
MGWELNQKNPESCSRETASNSFMKAAVGKIFDEKYRVVAVESQS